MMNLLTRTVFELARLTGVSLIAAVVALAVPPEPVSVSVCEVLGNLQKYKGKLLTIRGELVSGMEFTVLRDHGPCWPPFETGDHTWPSAIWLTGPGRYTDVGPSFREDTEAISAAMQTIKRLRGERKDVKVYVTYVGILEARERYQVYRNNNNRLVGNGYGHLAAFPAQLVVKTMRDPEVESREVQ